jgi:translation initiation factor IF-2
MRQRPWPRPIRAPGRGGSRRVACASVRGAGVGPSGGAVAGAHAPAAPSRRRPPAPAHAAGAASLPEHRGAAAPQNPCGVPGRLRHPHSPCDDPFPGGSPSRPSRPQSARQRPLTAVGITASASSVRCVAVGPGHARGHCDQAGAWARSSVGAGVIGVVRGKRAGVWPRIIGRPKVCAATPPFTAAAPARPPQAAAFAARVRRTSRRGAPSLQPRIPGAHARLTAARRAGAPPPGGCAPPPRASPRPSPAGARRHWPSCYLVLRRAVGARP